MSEQKIPGGFPAPGSPPGPGDAVIFGSFLRLGITSFGGPAMIAHIKEMSVKRNGWLTEGTFRDGIVICQSLPGATAMQMAAYVGLRLGGVRGAFASYVGFGLPAFLLMLVLAVLYSGSREVPLVLSLFQGLQVMVVAIVGAAIAGSLMFKESAPPPASARKEGDTGHVPGSIVIFMILAFAGVGRSS